jgi:hypothetical protein
MKIVDKFIEKILFKNFSKSKALILSFKKQQEELRIGRPTPDIEIKEAIYEWITLLKKALAYQVLCGVLLLVVILMYFNL